jgi:hypothetical protein
MPDRVRRPRAWPAERPAWQPRRQPRRAGRPPGKQRRAPPERRQPGPRPCPAAVAGKEGVAARCCQTCRSVNHGRRAGDERAAALARATTRRRRRPRHRCRAAPPLPPAPQQRLHLACVPLLCRERHSRAYCFALSIGASSESCSRLALALALALAPNRLDLLGLFADPLPRQLAVGLECRFRTRAVMLAELVEDEATHLDEPRGPSRQRGVRNGVQSYLASFHGPPLQRGSSRT